MRVLALVPGGIDDQILFFPTLDHLKQAFPKVEIDVVTEPSAKAAYSISKAARETIPYPFTSRNSPADWANLLGIIRDREYDVALTLTQSWSLGLLLWLSGIPIRIGYTSPSNDLFLTATVPLKTQQYQAEQDHDLLKPLNIDAPCPPASLSLPQRSLDWADQQRQRSDIGDQGYVALYPGAAVSASGPDIYPVTAWCTILKDFQHRQPDLPLVVIQQPETVAIVSQLTQALSGLRVIQTDTIDQLAAILAGANLVLSTDSYPLYLAVTLNVFALGLFGEYDPARRLPPAEGDDTRFIGIPSASQTVADIAPETVLKAIWNE